MSTRPRLVTPVFLLVTFSNFFYFLSVGALIPVLPRYVQGTLGGGDVAVGVVVGTFSLAAVLLRPLTGRISDQRGRRLLILLGSAMVVVSVIGYSLTSSLIPLLLLRLITGAGEAFFYVGVASAINDISPDERRGEALSYFSLALYGGLAVGPIVGETVLGQGRFHLTWFVAAGAASIAFLLGWRVPDTRDPSIEPSERRRIVHPAAVMPGTVLAASIWGLSGFTTFVPLYALSIGLDGSRLVFALYSSIVMLIRSIGAKIPDKLGVRKTARAALTSSAVGLAIMALWPGAAGLYVGTVLFAVGQALAFPALMAIAVTSAPVNERGSVIGTFTAFFDLSFGLGAVSLGAVASAFDYRGAFGAAALVAAGGVALLFAYARRGDREAATAGLEAGPAPG